MLALNDVLFYLLAFLTVGSGIGVIAAQNPIYCALFLALGMAGVAGVFVSLNALFVAGVQLIVYAGAVMVLFVMVLMLFDLKHEAEAFSKGLISGALKLISAGVILGLITGSVYMSTEAVMSGAQAVEKAGDPTRALAEAIFTKYLFGFEAIGALLLIVAIGAVALSRISGGTHADS
jgi:NADH-quinone oxidoreductase subunit J